MLPAGGRGTALIGPLGEGSSTRKIRVYVKNYMNVKVQFVIWVTSTGFSVLTSQVMKPV